MKLVKFTLSSGKTAAFFIGNNNLVIHTDDSGHVRLCDGIHNNGGWKLDESYTVEQVVELIKNA